MYRSRRTFIKTTLGALALPSLSPIHSAFAQSTTEWKTYEVTTEISLKDMLGYPAQVWIPLPLGADRDFFKTLSIKTEGANAKKIGRAHV